MDGQTMQCMEVLHSLNSDNIIFYPCPRALCCVTISQGHTLLKNMTICSWKRLARICDGLSLCKLYPILSYSPYPLKWTLPYICIILLPSKACPVSNPEDYYISTMGHIWSVTKTGCLFPPESSELNLSEI